MRKSEASGGRPRPSGDHASRHSPIAAWQEEKEEREGKTILIALTGETYGKNARKESILDKNDHQDGGAGNMGKKKTEH